MIYLMSKSVQCIQAELIATRVENGSQSAFTPKESVCKPSCSAHTVNASVVHFAHTIAPS